MRYYSIPGKKWQPTDADEKEAVPGIALREETSNPE